MRRKCRKCGDYIVRVVIGQLEDIDVYGWKKSETFPSNEDKFKCAEVGSHQPDLLGIR